MKFGSASISVLVNSSTLSVSVVMGSRPVTVCAASLDDCYELFGGGLDVSLDRG